ncbi:hypothetical protein S40285_10071 [Stachybotrys chlorohalonatus IBT 40285]|uniref:Uncharacterized protein n=1 Tax=Stachybotrys chlorohalonatus (strain IBT 40285) TaxID=1283841 RepID=A0A084QMC8_STAC4|nr:hypothetical protein S40285_10071 [Stachybotrys chlorohalonata IBT 40285]
MGLPLFIAPANSASGKSKPENRPTVRSFWRVVEALDKEHEYQGYADLDRVLRGTGLRAFRARERLLHEVRREPEDDDVLEVVVPHVVPACIHVRNKPTVDQSPFAERFLSSFGTASHTVQSPPPQITCSSLVSVIAYLIMLGATRHISATCRVSPPYIPTCLMRECSSFRPLVSTAAEGIGPTLAANLAAPVSA